MSMFLCVGVNETAQVDWNGRPAFFSWEPALQGDNGTANILHIPATFATQAELKLPANSIEDPW